MINPANEIWQIDSAFTEIAGESADITYRSNGEKLVMWESGNDVVSNWGVVVNGNSTSTPHVATNAQNQRDIVATWCYVYNGTFLCGKEILP